MAKSKDKTLLQKMQEICPYHIAKYVQWYLSDQKKRCKWDELCQCDMQFKSKDGKTKQKNSARTIGSFVMMLRKQLKYT